MNQNKTWKEIRREFILPAEQNFLTIYQQMNLALERAQEVIDEN